MAKKSIVQSKPTRAAYVSLERAFGHFNRTLFGNKLPPCLITLQRHANSRGYFSGGRFARVHTAKSRSKAVVKFIDEIAINPQYIAERSPAKVLSTLAHEMVHLWQHHFGEEPTRCYHDRQWATKMHEIGLHPSSTGEPGGNEVGPSVSHYIKTGGPFAKSCAKFLGQNRVAFYQDRAAAIQSIRALTFGKAGTASGVNGKAAAVKSPGRIKFVCGGCELNAWAKPSANIRCGDCNRPMKPDGGK